MFRHAQSNTIEITVNGANGQATYNLHQSLLVEKSDYFAACLREDSFAEAAEMKVKLDDCDTRAFAYFVKFLYNGKLDASDHSTFMVDVYVLADRLLCMGLKNNAVDALRCHVVGTALQSTKEITQLIHAGLPQSKMTDYLLDELAQSMKGKADYVPDANNQEWKDFVGLDAGVTTQLMLRLLEGKPKKGPRPDLLEGCKYHDHGAAGDQGCKPWKKP